MDGENEYKQLDIDIVEVDVGQDLMSGRIKFHGAGYLVSFDVMVQMVQSGKAEIASGVTMEFVSTLHETIGIILMGIL